MRPPSLADRWATVAFVVASTALPQLFLAVPFASLVSALWGDRSEGGGVLLRPGGYFALETVRLLRRELGAAATTAPFGLLLLSIALLLPWGCLLVSLSRPGRLRPVELLSLSLGRLPPLFFLLGAGLLLRVVLALVGYALVDVVGRGLGGDSAPRETAAMAALSLATIGLFALARVWHDLAQAAAVRHAERGAAAALTGADTLRKRFLPATVAYGWRALVSLALVLAAAALSTAVDTTSGAGIALVGVAHQATLAALVVLRCGWLRDALSLVGAPMPTGDDLDEP